MSHIYKITNLINGKIYIGKSLREDASYMGSGLQILSAIKKHGKDNFCKEVIEYCSPEILNQREIFWINQLNSRDNRIGYNISIGGTGGNHYWETLTDKEKLDHNTKISKSRKGQKTLYTDKQRSNVRAALGRLWNDKKDDTEWLLARANPKKYILSDGTEFIRIENLTKYAKEHNLDKTWLCSISTGNKINPNKGYYCFLDTGISDNDVLLLIAELVAKQLEVKSQWLHKTRNKKKDKCIHCGAEVTMANLTKWHNNNCKKK
jgi:group I intron endonuclease